METHCEGLRAAAVAAGPDAPVPTCPRWTVHRLVGHLGRVYSWVTGAIADPANRDIAAEYPPQTWEALLHWWDSQHDALVEAFGTDPAAPAWVPYARYEQCVASWARRMAHETAVHRLDAEQATSARRAVFDPEFAADGIDELLTMLVPSRDRWSEAMAAGSVLVHATDVGSGWVLRLSPGAPPQVEMVTAGSSGFSADLTIAGNADAVYRAVWQRPNDATVTGDTALLTPIASP